MERKTSIENTDSLLIKKHGLIAGKKVVFEKVAINSNSGISIGSKMSGVLDSDLKIGQPIYLNNKKSTISNIKSVEEKNGDFYITTNTSEYKLVYDIKDIAGVETAKGSRYKYLDNGTTQRFKKVENKNYEPQLALVYVPDFNWITKNISPKMPKFLSENQGIYEQSLLEYVQGENKKCYIVNKDGKKLETNQEILNEKGNVYLTFGDEQKVDFYIPVSIVPKIGFYTYDTRKYKDEKTGDYKREIHLGNKVVKIIRKGEKF